MSIRVCQSDFFVTNTRLRMPFRYGIAEATALPHLFVKLTLEVDGKRVVGLTSEGLPPKWFRKDPQQTFRDELGEMLHVIETACDIASEIGERDTVFDLWQELYAGQMRWSIEESYPPLLWSLGPALVERAVIDGFCRARGLPFHQAVRENLLGIRLSEMHVQLGDAQPADLLPHQPSAHMAVRHTVGLSDPITDADIAAGERLDDGLPQSLEASIDAYGLRYFKIKVKADQAADYSADMARLRAIAAVLEAKTAGDYHFTLDGNESFASADAFAGFCEALAGDATLAPFCEHMLAIEQPLHRDVAMSAEAADVLEDFEFRPIIIDESDAMVSSLPAALECGYAGVSVKNCKGVIKGIANGCLIRMLQRDDPDRQYLLTAEDLCNVGPVALMQDLASAASLGLTHIERNGHHFLRGLSFLPESLQRDVVAAHGDLYRMHEGGFATLKIDDGHLSLASVNAAAYGLGLDLDLSQFTPLDDWTFESLGLPA